MAQRSIHSERGAAVRSAFFEQAALCARLGSPFTALLCRVLGEGLDSSHDLERFILEWCGDPGPFADSLPLRLAGALHSLVRTGRAPQLARLYPPHPLTDPQALCAAVRSVVQEQAGFVHEFLRHPPQTNEVGRSAVLLPGWLEIAARTGYPLSLFEIGSSAGLNLFADRYAYRFGDVSWRRTAAPTDAHGASGEFTVACGWSGPLPPLHAPLRIRSRCGCDRHPLNVTDPVQRERLMAYVWAGQQERLERLEAALRVVQAEPVSVEVCEAHQWLPAVLPRVGEPNVTRVVFHSIVWSYLEPSAQDQIVSHLADVGAAATTERPLAWLRLELVGPDEPAALRLTLWPGGAEEVLARAHPHGVWVRWRD